MAASVNWDTALASEPSYGDLDFRRKQDRRDVPGVLEFGAKNGLQLPFGISSLPEVGLLLSRAALPYDESTQFDDLPLPFRAVSFDYLRLRKYVPSGGSLPLAIRASNLRQMFGGLGATAAAARFQEAEESLGVYRAKPLAADLAACVRKAQQCGEAIQAEVDRVREVLDTIT